MAEKDTDAGYRAIGRWFVGFSRLVFVMKTAMEMRFARDANTMEPKILLGEAMADQCANAFFELCKYVADPNDEEIKILKKLKKEVGDQITRRNDFAHGDWLPWLSDEGTVMLWRTKPGRASEPWTIKEIPIAELDEWADALFALARTVGEVGYLCLNPLLMEQLWEKPVRLSDVYSFTPGSQGKRGQRSVASKITRDGPVAHEHESFS